MKNFSLIHILYFQSCFYLLVDGALNPLSRLDTSRTNGSSPLTTRSLKQSKECLKVVYILGFNSESITVNGLKDESSNTATLEKISTALEDILKEIKGDFEELEPEINVEHVNVWDRSCPKTFTNSTSCIKFETEIDVRFDISRDELETSVEKIMENGEFFNRIKGDSLSEFLYHRVTDCGEEGFTTDHIVVLSTLVIMVLTVVLLFVSKRRSRKRDGDSEEVAQEDNEEAEEVEPEPIEVGFRNRFSEIVPEGDAKNYEELKTERVVNKFRGSEMPTNVGMIDIEDDEEEEKREIDDHHMDLELVNVRVQEEFLPTSESTSTRSLMTGSVAYNV